MLIKTPIHPSPPKTEKELMARAMALSGKTVAELSKAYCAAVPQSHQDAKGFVGKMLEWHLGADSNNLPQPDFLHLGIELKTLPLTAQGLAQESTYVCTAPFNTNESWATSRVRTKLNHVLWMPFEADKRISPIERRIASPLLWHLSPDLDQILSEDWEELTTALQLGHFDSLSAKLGRYLQIRPKAAHSRILSQHYNHEGETTYVNPKGFYLRTSFTNQILKQNYCFFI